MSRLAVHWDDDLVGHVERAGQGGDLVFAYAASYLGLAAARPISVALPLQPEPFSAELSTAWFANLLPEGEVRSHVARRLGVSERNDFGLLAGLGGDCAGALVLVPEDGPAPGDRAPDREPLSWSELEETVNRSPRPSLLALMLSDAELRLSLAGAQDKLPVCLDGDELSLPVGGAASTHLVKVASAAFSGLVANELFCLDLARRVGLPVPAARLAPTETPMLLVERYDRARDAAATTTRLHQEDLCQALGVPPDAKYEAEGGPGLADAFALVTRVSARPLVDRRDLLRWVLMNDLLGNADAHGKNLSLLHGTRGHTGAPVLAPFYDLVCTAVYPELTRRQAMKIGGENRPERIEARHWRRFAEEAGLRPRFVRDAGLELCRTVAEELAGGGAAPQRGGVAAGVVDLVRRRSARLASELQRLA